MQFSFWENVRDLMLSPITNEYLELALVMLIIPLFVNVSFDNLKLNSIKC